MRIVMKFGGAALSSPDEIYERISLVKKYTDENKIVIVTSAIKGVTDTLLSTIENAVEGRRRKMIKNLKTISSKHIELVRSLELDKDTLDYVNRCLDEIDKMINSVYNLREITPRAKDYILSFGEKLATRIFSDTLRMKDVEAEYFTGGDAGIVTDSNYGEANPELELIERLVKIRLLPYIEDGKTPVITGFIGIDKEGHVTTLGRGGSDLTASLLGYALDAEEVWFWKDVPGIMTADPKIVDNPKKISILSYMEAAELSALGAKVIHPRAIAPLMRKRIPLRIKGYLKPNYEGTVVRTNSGRWDKIVKAVTLIKGLSLINIYSTYMIGVPGVSGRIFSALGSRGINIIMISQNVSEANISLLIHRKYLKNALEALRKVADETRYIEEITYDDEVAAISVVGEGMRGTPGIASKLFTSVADKDINIKMIAQGSSEINISFVVELKKGEEAVKAIYNSFNLGD
jgi:aspartate kinase